MAGPVHIVLTELKDHDIRFFLYSGSVLCRHSDGDCSRAKTFDRSSLGHGSDAGIAGPPGDLGISRPRRPYGSFQLRRFAGSEIPIPIQRDALHSGPHADPHRFFRGEGFRSDSDSAGFFRIDHSFGGDGGDLTVGREEPDLSRKLLSCILVDDGTFDPQMPVGFDHSAAAEIREFDLGFGLTGSRRDL